MRSFIRSSLAIVTLAAVSAGFSFAAEPKAPPKAPGLGGAVGSAEKEKPAETAARVTIAKLLRINDLLRLGQSPANYQILK